MKDHPTTQRGSVVLVALCLTFALGLVVVAYVALCMRTMEMSNRSFCYTSSVQLAEIGLEEALWSLNNSSWSGWHTSGDPPAGTAIKSEDYNNALHFTTNQGIPGSVSITVDNYNTTDPFNAPPTIIATATLTMPGNTSQIHTPPIQKTLKVIVKPAALFSNAVGSTATINSSPPPPPPPNPPYYVDFTSGGSVDSYDSSLKDSDGNCIPYTPSPQTRNLSDQAIISGPYVFIGAANVLGYAMTANSNCPISPYFYPPFITTGSVTNLAATDNNRLSNNANQYAFDIVTPTGAGITATDANDLITQTGGLLGTPGASTPSIYHVTGDLTLSGSDILTINGPVIIDVSSNPGNPCNLNIQDSARIVVTKGSDSTHDGSAQIYVAGNLDIEGPVYVADSTNDTIRKITPAGVVTTLAGSTGSAGSADGTGSAAQFNAPSGVAVDDAGNVYVADTSNSMIRKIIPTVTNGVTTWVVTTLAGLFNAPGGVAVDAAGNVYVADTGNSTIRKIDPYGVVTTLAGTAGTRGYIDGTGIAAQFNAPSGVAVDDAGNVYVADTGNNTIRMITPIGVVSTLAGSAGPPGSTDGTGNAARFSAPKAVAVDSAGDVYVADTGNSTIREITPTGLVTTLAGSPGSAGSADGIGNAARFAQPSGLATYTTGNLYVADTGNDTIRKITPAGVVTTLAGSVGSVGSVDGTNSARFNSPTGLAVSRGGIKNLTQRPRNLAVFCNGSTQSTIDTSIAFYGAVYAPNSPLVVNVNLTIYGALVGQSVTFNGYPTIHYDLDLWKASFSVVNTPYDVSQWNVSN